MPNVLVLDAQMRHSLAIIRSLGKAGLKVTGGEETRFATGLFSKYCSKKITYPSPHKEPDKFLNSLQNILRTEKYDALFAVSDATILPIVKNKDELSKYTRIPFPDYDHFIKASDKAQTLRIALENGVPCPKTFFIDDPGELNTIKDQLSYPAIIKPRLSSGSRGISLCKTSNELSDKYQKVKNEFGPSIIQEYIPNGGEVGVYTLFNRNSEPRAVSVQKRIRSYPVSGGPSTFRETIYYPELVDTAVKLLKALNWTGVAMVEFRIDARNNEPKLMEINPRFWGSLNLSILSGVDFPYLLYRLLKEGDIVPNMDYKSGEKCRWILPGDILWYLNSANKIKNLPDLLQITNDDIISLKDPGPTLGFILATMRYMLDADMWQFALRKPIESR